MPKRGESCLVITITPDGEVYKNVYDASFKVNQLGEAISVPPHGDLIDLSTVNLENGPYEYRDWVEWALEQYQDALTFMRGDL
ncbi:MAG: hypothetical protein J6T10_32090 [Methanobrevibacter sp.]|nr:hypothetical protein [Methanobrevibacter sp.]